MPPMTQWKAGALPFRPEWATPAKLISTDARID
jgi:hypothetical protein